MTRTKTDQYAEDYAVLGSYTAVARKHGVGESTVRHMLKRRAEREGVDPLVDSSMEYLGLDTVPHGGWIKSQTPDENGNLYSWYVKPRTVEEEERKASLQASLDDTFRNIPAVRLPKPRETAAKDQLGFIPLNDLHGGLYAWGEETGYGDWDLSLATERLEGWVGQLVAKMPACQECILYFNGDTLHANGNDPFTPASKHVLDVDTRQFKVVDAIATSIITATDLAAQKHGHVRLVIKRGNHDEDAYLALLMAAKWRYREQDNVTVDLDPSSYWVYPFGKVLLFGHHGDKRKPQELVMKMMSDHREVFGKCKHAYLWTGHLHERAVKMFYGVQWEQASCLTEPDIFGAAFGSNAEARAHIYDAERGEIETYSVRPEGR